MSAPTRHTSCITTESKSGLDESTPFALHSIVLQENQCRTNLPYSHMLLFHPSPHPFTPLYEKSTLCLVLKFIQALNVFLTHAITSTTSYVGNSVQGVRIFCGRTILKRGCFKGMHKVAVYTRVL